MPPRKEIHYPVRMRIIDVEAGPQQVIKSAMGRVYTPKTPDKSRPHVGKEGVAEKLHNGDVRITLSDGTILWGWECWWEPI